MLEHVNSGQVEKITKMCARGMDPNFHCPDSGGKEAFALVGQAGIGDSTPAHTLFDSNLVIQFKPPSKIYINMT